MNQDEFCGRQFTTRKGGTLTILEKVKNNQYYVHCSICNNDSELYPEPFLANKTSTKRNTISCGCGCSPKPTINTHIAKVLIKRKIEENDHKDEFLGFDNKENEFVNSLGNLKLFCKIHKNIYTMKYNSYVNTGHRCMDCAIQNRANKKRRSSESLINDINKCIIEKGNLDEFIRFDNNENEYSSSKTKIVLKCLKHNKEYSLTARNYLQLQNRCYDCGIDKIAKFRTLSTDDAINAIEKQIKILGDLDEFVGFDNKDNIYTHGTCKLIFRCKEHNNEYSVRYTKFIRRNQRCPHCTACGYHRTKPASFYMHKWFDDKGTEFIKYGITNRTVKERHQEQRRKTEFKSVLLAHYHFKDGEHPLAIENIIKNNIGMNFICSTKFKDGFSETFSTEHLDHALNLIKSYFDERKINPVNLALKIKKILYKVT